MKVPSAPTTNSAVTSGEVQVVAQTGSSEKRGKGNDSFFGIKKVELPLFLERDPVS